MGGSSSKGRGKVISTEPPLVSNEPPYPGPPAHYHFLNTSVNMASNVSFSFANSMVTTNIDSYYPILGQKYAEGYRLLSFYRIPGAAQSGGIFSFSINIPFQGIFCHYPDMPSNEGWQLRIEKSTMVTQRMYSGLISLSTTQGMVSDTSHILQAILNNTQDGGRLICIEETGHQQGQGVGMAMRGISPIIGVDVFFEVPTHPCTEKYLYQSVSVPISVSYTMSFGANGVSVQSDWNGHLASQLAQGWRLVEIFLDSGSRTQQTGFGSAAQLLNAVWFFEKPVSHVNDLTPIYQGMVVEHHMSISATFGGAKAHTNWEPTISQLGTKGWELACILETPEVRMRGIGSYDRKLILFFQRRILPPLSEPGYVGGPDYKGAPIPSEAPPPYPGVDGSAPPSAGFK